MRKVVRKAYSGGLLGEREPMLTRDRERRGHLMAADADQHQYGQHQKHSGRIAPIEHARTPHSCLQGFGMTHHPCKP